MARTIQTLKQIQPRLAARGVAPSSDDVAVQLYSTIDALIEAEALAASSQLAAEYSDSHERIRTMLAIREELEVAAASLHRASARLLKFYGE